MDLIGMLTSLGPIALLIVFAIVFVENGLLFPFLPGDSLVFAAAILAGALNLPWLLVVGITAIAAIAGGELGFVLGRRYGRGLFKPGARAFKPEYLTQTEAFFERWGSAALVLARFVPIVRTYIAPAAGISAMRHRRFSVWNAASGIIWAGVLGVAGYLLGSIPWVASNVEWIMLGIIVITVAPVVITGLAKRRRDAAATAAAAGEAGEASGVAERSHEDMRVLTEEDR